jgi:hypothetical protein
MPPGPAAPVRDPIKEQDGEDLIFGYFAILTGCSPPA